MRNTTILVIVAASIALCFASMPVFAHHSFAAEFDVKQPMTLKGTVTKVEWTNPHVWIYMDVAERERRRCNIGSARTARRTLWRAWAGRGDSLKAGDQMTVEGFRAKNDDKTANARQITLPDGRKVFSGSAEDGGPGKAKDSGQ